MVFNDVHLNKVCLDVFIGNYSHAFLMIVASKKGEKSVVTKTGRVELTVCVQTTFKIDDSSIFGKRICIFRSGRCEFTAYIEMDELNWKIDSTDGNLLIFCPKVRIDNPKYHFNEIDCIYEKAEYVRDGITLKEKHDEEKKMVEQLKDSLSKSEVFRSKLISKAHRSAEILLPRLLIFDNSLTPTVKFED